VRSRQMGARKTAFPCGADSPVNWITSAKPSAKQKSRASDV
jgi:hypothetical protein